MVEGSRIRREYAITLGRNEGAGRRGKLLIADYVLEYRNTKLAIRPTYATNGRDIYSVDMQTGAEGEIPAYPTPDQHAVP